MVKNVTQKRSRRTEQTKQSIKHDQFFHLQPSTVWKVMEKLQCYQLLGVIQNVIKSTLKHSNRYLKGMGDYLKKRTNKTGRIESKNVQRIKRKTGLSFTAYY